MFCLMLHAHPQLAMGFEPYFVPAMWPMRDHWERPDGFDLDSLATGATRRMLIAMPGGDPTSSSTRAAIGPTGSRPFASSDATSGPSAISRFATKTSWTTRREYLRTVCAFSELEYDLCMLDYHEDGTSALVGVRAGIRGHRSSNLPPTGGLRDWRRDFSRRELERFEAAVGDVLETFGYEVNKRPSPRARLELMTKRAASRFRNARKQVRRVRRRLRRLRGTHK